MFECIIRELGELPEIEAIALGGSRAGSHFDEKSDYDIYLYCTGPVPESMRREILEKYCSTLEIGNQYWELEDNGTFRSGIDFDILYRDLDSFAAGIADVVENCRPQNAYTTCMWHNLLTCRILLDKTGRLTEVQKQFAVPYPPLLRERIITRNWKLLCDSMPAYQSQIIKAAKRGDLVSVNHRCAAFLETYFDLLFALNHQTHPGEKRLVQLARERCSILPERFEENLQLLFCHMFHGPHLLEDDLKRILDALSEILRA